MRHYGWHYQVELVARLEGIPLGDAYELTTLHFLNDLAYLKAKGEHERHLSEEAIKRARMQR
jgi:hypothetical protein